MANIKPEAGGRLRNFWNSREGEIACVLVIGGILWTAGATVVGYTVSYISNVIYPFSYMFVHAPLASFLPRTATAPPLIGNLIFGALFSLAIYMFEKNIFYRRFHLALKAAFAAVAACVFVFLSRLLLILIGIDTDIFITAEATELPQLFIYYYIASLPVFALSRLIRREIFLMP